MPNVPPYVCPACRESFDRYADYDVHRTTVHGRTADGAPAITLESRVSALERQIVAMRAEIERMTKASEP